MKTYFSVAALAFSATLIGQTKEQPNILWLTFEDTSPDFIGCYGNEQAKTPTIDRLAKEGVRFDNAYSTSAVSSPSRFCLITGVRTQEYGTGNHRSQYPIPDDIKGFPYYLRQAGYYTANNVKTDYSLANPKRFIQEAWNESSNKAGWWNRQPGQPFFAVYNSTSSHQSRTMTYPWSKYEKEVLENLSKDQIIPEGNLKMPAYYHNSTDMQHYISRVYNSIQLMDIEFGQWLDRLERDGLKDSTIIFCFSDHGQGISRSKGCALRSGYQVSFVAWFPPMYKHLSPWGSGVITDELVSFEDMAPTILKLAGVAVPAHMKGRVFAGDKPQPRKQYVFSSLDRTDSSNELSRSVNDGRYLFTRVFMPFQPFLRWNTYYDVSDLQQEIRNDYKAGLLNSDQRRMLEPRQAEYLFDMKNDQWELVNLVDQPEMKSKVAELRTVLIRQILSERDALFMPEYTYQKENKMPVKLAADDQYYPVKKVLDAALLVGKGKSVIGSQLKLMSDQNQFVRYWATLGLFSQPSLTPAALKSMSKQLATENYPPAKVNEVVTLFKNSNKKIYLQEVRALLNQPDPEVIRITVHLLLTLDMPKQLLLVDDMDALWQKLKSQKVKAPIPPQELISLFMHNVKGEPLRDED